MYDTLQMICLCFMLVYGLLCAICPNKIIKEEYKNDEARLSKLRVLGVLITICAVGALAIHFSM